MLLDSKSSSVEDVLFSNSTKGYKDSLLSVPGALTLMEHLCEARKGGGAQSPRPIGWGHLQPAFGSVGFISPASPKNPSTQYPEGATSPSSASSASNAQVARLLPRTVSAVALGAASPIPLTV